MPISAVSEIRLNIRPFSPQGQDMLQRFLNSVNRLREDLNKDIDVYNKATDIAERRERLALIEIKMKNIDDLQSDEILALCPDYFRQFHIKLFEEIQQEKIALSVLKQPVTLDQLIAQMPPEKVNTLTHILAHTNNTSLQTEVEKLYQAGDQGKNAYDAFWASHRIRALGGSNSKNFVIQNIRTLEQQVLKIENRLGNPKQPERALENTKNTILLSALTPNHAERQTLYFDFNANQQVSRTLLVTDFCSGSNVETYCENIPNTDAKIIQAISINLRMAEILQGMQAEQRAFPDMKNTNWLIDDKNHVRLADRKAFIATDSNGNIPPNADVIQTAYMSAPEILYNSPDFHSAEKMHVYMLGKNLYQTLTGCSYKDFYKNKFSNHVRTDASELDFSAAIFQTPQGAELKQLIQSTVLNNPNKRLSLDEYQARLKKIDPQYQQAESRATTILLKQCRAHLNIIQSYGITTKPPDRHMQDFITKNMHVLQKNLSLHEVLSLEKDLAQTSTRLKQISPSIKASENKINDLKKHGFHVLADLLENLLCAIPIEDRHLMFESGTPEAHDFNNIMAKITAHDKRIMAQTKLCDAIEALSFGSQDQAMQRFIQPYKDKLNLPSTHATPENSEAFTHELQDKLTKLRNQTENFLLRLKDYRKEGFTTYVDAIEAHVAKMPIEKRTQLNFDEHPELTKLIGDITKEQDERALKKQLDSENRILLSNIRNEWGATHLLSIIPTMLAQTNKAQTSDELRSIQSNLHDIQNILQKLKTTTININKLGGDALTKTVTRLIHEAETYEELARIFDDLQSTKQNLAAHDERIKALPPELSTFARAMQNKLKTTNTIAELDALYSDVKSAPHTCENILSLLEQIQTYEINMFDIKDKHMKTFITSTINELNQATTSEQLTSIHNKVQSTLSALDNAKPMIDHILKSVSSKKLFMESKAKRIVSG